MLQTVWQKQKERKNIMIFLGIFAIVYSLYLFLDWLYYGSFGALFAEMSVPLFMVHQAINITIALIATLMLSLSQIKLQLTNSEPKGATSIPFLSFIFGLLTFGCAPCVIAFLGAVGITFTPVVLPFSNLPWKLILLALMVVAFFYILKTIDSSSCKVKSLNSDPDIKVGNINIK